MPVRPLKDIGNVLLIWFSWSVVYFFFATFGNPEANYEKIFYILLTNLPVAAGAYWFGRYYK